MSRHKSQARGGGSHLLMCCVISGSYLETPETKGEKLLPCKVLPSKPLWYNLEESRARNCPVTTSVCITCMWGKSTGRHFAAYIPQDPCSVTGSGEYTCLSLSWIICNCTYIFWEVIHWSKENCIIQTYSKFPKSFDENFLFSAYLVFHGNTLGTCPEENLGIIMVVLKWQDYWCLFFVFSNLLSSKFYFVF